MVYPHFQYCVGRVSTISLLGIGRVYPHFHYWVGRVSPISLLGMGRVYPHFHYYWVWRVSPISLLGMGRVYISPLSLLLGRESIPVFTTGYGEGISPFSLLLGRESIPNFTAGYRVYPQFHYYWLRRIYCTNYCYTRVSTTTEF